MILVTGMHRSGTSLVAMTLEAMGVPFGDHSCFYSADEWNARGYFERRDVMDINSRMITGFARTQGRLGELAGQVRYLMRPGVDGVVARGHRFRDQMVSIDEEIGGGAIKDPRLCLTWRAWADAVEIDAVVVCARHPMDVADSLRRRQRIPMTIGLGFWRYHLAALEADAPERLVVIELGRLIADPGRELDRLRGALDLGVDSAHAVRRFRELYSPAMVGSGPAGKRPQLDAETAALWDWLLELSHSPTAGSVG